MTERSPDKAIHLLVVAPFPLSREGLKLVLSRLASAEAQVEVIDGDTLDAALSAMTSSVEPDALLVSSSSPIETRLTIKRLRQSHPGSSIVVLVNEYEPEALLPLYKSGVRAVIAKSCSLATVVSAVRLVIAGGTYYPEAMIDMLCMPVATDRAAAGAWRPLPIPAPWNLRPRQTSVLQLLLEGRSNHEIGMALGLRLGTVKNYVTAVLKHLGARNRVEAVLLAQQLPMHTAEFNLTANTTGPVDP